MRLIAGVGGRDRNPSAAAALRTVTRRRSWVAAAVVSIAASGLAAVDAGAVAAAGDEVFRPYGTRGGL